MALFKISKGKSTNLPANKVNGYCYVTTDEHKLYVDYTKDDGTLDRFALNANYADIAGSVSKLGEVNIGDSNKPIYLEDGTPKECVDFLPLSAGKSKKLTGPLGLTENINYGTSLPDNGFVGQLFFLEEEDKPSLPTGGTAGQVLVKNSSTDGDASWATDIEGNAATATKAIQDGDGNVISSTYLPLSGGTMTGVITFQNTKNSPANGTQMPIIKISYQNGEGTYYNGVNIIAMLGTGETGATNNTSVRFGSTSGSTFITSGESGSYMPAKLGTNNEHLWLTSDSGTYFYNGCANNGTSYTQTLSITSSKITAHKPLYGAVWNDYAEFRICNEDFKPGQVVCENNDDTLSISTYRLQPGANIVSDTYGFAIGETDDAKCPIAVSGRVLAYTYELREEFKAGDAVCAGPNGTVSKMTREEIREYPERIIGTVSAVPDYEIWGSGNVEVNGRIWIKVM